jgi:predicted permease
MNLRDLKLRVRALFSPRRVERDLDDELTFHIERETRKHIASGMSPDEARMRARARFGSVTVAADECRDARGTAFFDNLVRDVLYAFRSFRRAPLVALTIMTTVGLGLGLVAVVFTILNTVIFRVDEVRDVHEMFEVERQRSANAEPERFTRPQFEALVRETSVFSEAFATGPEIDRWIDGRRMEGELVTGNFFHVLGVGAERGRTLTLSDDLETRQVIVLSHRGWSRYFASDPGVLTRTVQVNGVPFQVVGVMPESFRGLTVAAPDFWAPFSLVGQFRRLPAGDENRVPAGIIGRLKPGVTRGQALAELAAWDARHAAERPVPSVPSASPVPSVSSVERPRANLILEPRQGTIPLSTEVMLLFMPLFFAFGLVLMIGCANVANLLLARGVTRQREIGIRLAIGASRRRIILQLLTESLLLALVSAALAFGISRLALSAVIYAVTSTFPPSFGDIRLPVPPPDWRVALFLLAGAMISTLFFALAPALHATRLELVRAMRGEVAHDARPSRARNGLVALQVTASVLLLICSAIFLRSAWSAATVDPGFRTVDIVTVTVGNEKIREAMLEAVKREQSIASIAASWPGSLGGRPVLADGATGKSTVTQQFVSPEYFSVLDIGIVRGRGFAPTERGASNAVAIVSESTARQLWPGADAIGQILRLEPDPKKDTRELDDLPVPSQALVVVGIARDVPGFRFAGARMPGAGVYVPIDAEAARTALTLRVRGDSERAARVLGERFAAIDPNFGEVATLQTIAGMEAYFLHLGFWLTLVLGALALLLTLSGLFSVLSYLVEQRTREIGVRMTLGATRQSVGALVLSQSARPVGIGLFIGGSLTAALGAALLATPAAEQIGTFVGLFDPVAYAASLFTIVMACACAALIPALRAGRIDPVTALRQD